jgi:hypothetical protein
MMAISSDKCVSLVSWLVSVDSLIMRSRPFGEIVGLVVASIVVV